MGVWDEPSIDRPFKNRVRRKTGIAGAYKVGDIAYLSDGLYQKYVIESGKHWEAAPPRCKKPTHD
jgi:hypothetical protein